jgi:hypothetical protein
MDFLGAYICAKIIMGQVRVVTSIEICQVSNITSWWNIYDTI